MRIFAAGLSTQRTKTADQTILQSFLFAVEKGKAGVLMDKLVGTLLGDRYEDVYKRQVLCDTQSPAGRNRRRPLSFYFRRSFSENA